MHKRVKSISEGAMMIALIMIVLFFNRQFAGTFELFFFILSVPIVIYTVKYGMKMGVTLVVSTMLLGFLFSTMTGLFYLASALLIGLFYSYGLLHQKNNAFLLSTCIVGNVIVTIVTVVLFSALFGYSISDDIEMFSALMTFVDETFAMDISTYIVMLVVVLYLAGALLQAILTHLLCVLVLKRLKIMDRQVKVASTIFFPRSCGFLALLSYPAYGYMDQLSSDTILYKLILIYYSIFFILSILDGFLWIVYFKKKKTGKGFKLVGTYVLMLGCLLPLIQNIIAFLGIYDMLAQARKKELVRKEFA